VSSIAIGISGEVAAGKTTAGKALRRLGFGYTRISKVIDRELAAMGKGPSRERHQELGWKLHNEKGQAWLCEEAIALIGFVPVGVVLDGVRWPEDVEYLRKRYGRSLLHIHVTAPPDTRERRFKEDAKGIEYEDVISHPVEQAVASLANLADQVLANDGLKEAFLVDVFGAVIKKQLNAR
jgi:dephospho-CoA kinase